MKSTLRQLNQNRHTKFNTVILKRFLDLTTKLSHLNDELQDYHRFFRSYISFIFVFYVMLISFIIYVSLFSGIAVYVKIIYLAALVAHIILLSVIIYYCGGIVQRNVVTSFELTSILMHFSRNCNKSLTGFQLLKLHNTCMDLKSISLSGFDLLNGYLITFDTYRLLIVNITIYMILIL